MDIYTESNMDKLKDVPSLENQIYVYVLLNSPQGNIKIGKTTNIYKRVKSLSGSNNGGNKIIKCYCSPATYMNSMEHICQDRFDTYRIKGTEWFNGSKLDYDTVVKYVDDLFHSDDFNKCNDIRREYMEKRRRI